MEHTVRTENYDKIKLSEHEGGLWLSIWHTRAHSSVHLNQDQIKELHEAIGEYIKEHV